MQFPTKSPQQEDEIKRALQPQIDIPNEQKIMGGTPFIQADTKSQYLKQAYAAAGSNF